MMQEYRRRIDEIDDKLMELIAERLDVVREIGRYKRKNGLPTHDESRESEKLQRLFENSNGVSAEYVEHFMTALFDVSKKEQQRSKNIYLIGMPDAGKTRFAVPLGARLNRRCADTDKAIMKRAGRTIDELFDSLGEEVFRILEQEALKQFAGMGSLVVATGGGVLTHEGNLEIMKASGYTVFLDRRLEKLYGQRISNRPLIREGDEAIKRLYDERHECYKSVADFIIDPDLPDALERITEFSKSVLDLD